MQCRRTRAHTATTSPRWAPRDGRKLTATHRRHHHLYVSKGREMSEREGERGRAPHYNVVWTAKIAPPPPR
jgi:hypothetical protein